MIHVQDNVVANRGLYPQNEITQGNDDQPTAISNCLLLLLSCFNARLFKTLRERNVVEGHFPTTQAVLIITSMWFPLGFWLPPPPQ